MLVDSVKIFAVYQSTGVVHPHTKISHGDLSHQLAYAMDYHHRPSLRSVFEKIVGCSQYSNGEWPPHRRRGWRPDPTSSLSPQERFFLYYEGHGQFLFITRLLLHGLLFKGMAAVQPQLPIPQLYKVFLRGGLDEKMQRKMDPLGANIDLVRHKNPATKLYAPKKKKKVHEISPSTSDDDCVVVPPPTPPKKKKKRNCASVSLRHDKHKSKSSNDTSDEDVISLQDDALVQELSDQSPAPFQGKRAPPPPPIPSTSLPPPHTDNTPPPIGHLRYSLDVLMGKSPVNRPFIGPVNLPPGIPPPHTRPGPREEPWSWFPPDNVYQSHRGPPVLYLNPLYNIPQALYMSDPQAYPQYAPKLPPPPRPISLPPPFPVRPPPPFRAPHSQGPPSVPPFPPTKEIAPRANAPPMAAAVPYSPRPLRHPSAPPPHYSPTKPDEEKKIPSLMDIKIPFPLPLPPDLPPPPPVHSSAPMTDTSTASVSHFDARVLLDEKKKAQAFRDAANDASAGASVGVVKDENLTLSQRVQRAAQGEEKPPLPAPPPAAPVLRPAADLSQPQASINKKLLDQKVLSAADVLENPYSPIPTFTSRCDYCSGTHCSRFLKGTQKPNCRKFREQVEYAPFRDVCDYRRCHSKHTHLTMVCPTLHSRCPKCEFRGHSSPDLCDPSNEHIMSRLRSDFEEKADVGIYTRLRHSTLAWGFYPYNASMPRDKDIVPYGELTVRSVKDANDLLQSLLLQRLKENQ